MLTPSRSLALAADKGKEMPRVEELTALYSMGVKFRQGQVTMIVGRSGTQKSGFAMWLTAMWGLPTLYLCADMSAFTASSRLAGMATMHTDEQIEEGMADPERRHVYLDAVKDMPFTFSFGSPIRWQAVEEELDAFIELHDAFPKVIVMDNLMDFEGAESDYSEQMSVMSNATELARETGATVILLHHASDKSWDAKTDPYSPPARNEVKGGLSEKPELSLSVALDPTSLEFKIACIKQRQGPCDPTARRYATVRCLPEYTRFAAY